jgi:hypothetical protein
MEPSASVREELERAGLVHFACGRCRRQVLRWCGTNLLEDPDLPSPNLVGVSAPGMVVAADRDGWGRNRVQIGCPNPRCRRHRSPWLVTTAYLRDRALRAVRAGTNTVILD